MPEKAATLERALFLLTGGDAGERFHRFLGDLVDAGLRAATLLHILDAGPQKGDSFLEEVSTWARRFEAAGVRKVSVALKRGDAVAWVREISAITPGVWVVAAPSRGTPEGTYRPASAWRHLTAPVLLVPERRSPPGPPLFERVVVGVRDPESDREDVRLLGERLPFVEGWRAIHVHTEAGSPARYDDYPVPLTVLEGDRYDIADNLVAAACEGAGLLVLFAQPAGADPTLPAGYVIEAIVRGIEVPVLLWPGQGEDP